MGTSFKLNESRPDQQDKSIVHSNPDYRKNIFLLVSRKVAKLTKKKIGGLISLAFFA
jgi:hypothetical protein